MPLGTEQVNMTELTATLAALTSEVKSLRAEVSELRRARSKGAELLEEVGPIGKEVMAGAIETLESLDKKGYFAFGSELIGVLDRVVAGYSADDVRDFGDNVVTIIDTVRSLTQPEVMAYAQRAGEAMEGTERKAPVGMWDMLKASRDRDIQQGVAVMLGVVRQIGRAARTRKMAAKPQLSHPGFKKVSRRLQRTRAAPRPRPAATPIAAPPAVQAVLRAPLPPQFADLPMDTNGHLADAKLWSRELAQAFADQEGLGPLTDGHWTIIEFARQAYEDKGKSPNVRAVAVGSGVGTKGVYQHFPKKPGVVVSRVAGIPKPVGCI